MTMEYADEINRSVPIPLYYQVSQIILREIQNGQYLPGDLIPTEAELRDRFGVSRATIRQAIGELVYMGLLERKRSKGTSVATGQLEATLHNLASFTNEMMSDNFDLKTRIVEFKYILPPHLIADILHLKTHETVALMERVRFVDEKPIAVERWYAPLKLFPRIDQKMFDETGMRQSTYYILMENYGCRISNAEDKVSAVGVEAHEAHILGIEPGRPVLMRTRISYQSENKPATYAIGVYLIHLRFTLGQHRL
jgi:GntR family transcriptional regulator